MCVCECTLTYRDTHRHPKCSLRLQSVDCIDFTLGMSIICIFPQVKICVMFTISRGARILRAFQLCAVATTLESQHYVHVSVNLTSSKSRSLPETVGNDIPLTSKAEKTDYQLQVVFPKSTSQSSYCTDTSKSKIRLDKLGVLRQYFVVYLPHRVGIPE